MKTEYQPKTGQACSCKRGQQRDNCPLCEGTGQMIDFSAIRKAVRESKDPIAEFSPRSGSYRTEDGQAQIDWELTQGEHGYKFSACGAYDRASGQCIEDIAKAYPDDQQVQIMADVWRKYHLNDMKAGTPEQLAEVERRRLLAEEYARRLGPEAAKYFYDKEQTQANWHSLCSLFGHDSYYSWECAVLREANLYETTLIAGIQALGGFPDEVLEGKRGYRFGERWLYSPIPQNVIDLIISWQNLPAKAPLHEDKAEQFLAEHGLKFRATLSDSKPAHWGKAGHHFRVCISRANSKGHQAKASNRLAFDFWGSVHDMTEGTKTVTPYDVLACISGDVHTPETFEAYCCEFGCEEDSIKARQTFTRANRFAKRLREFFTQEEIEALSEIR